MVSMGHRDKPGGDDDFAVHARWNRSSEAVALTAKPV
jgi:hypothetical protein